MIIDDKLCDEQVAKAQNNERRRVALDLRTTTNDGSQRVLNALIPGTIVPIHRHRSTTETVIVLRGSLTEIFYDENGVETIRHDLNPTKGHYGVQIPVNTWHTVIVHEPTVILEAKDGPYEPLAAEDTWLMD